MPRGGELDLGERGVRLFFGKVPPRAAFVIDELRLSSSPRYADLDVVFGGQQTVNP